MKTIDINKYKDLVKLRDSLNTVLENRITELSLNEKINSFDSFSFSTLKFLFENISDKLYDSKEGRSIIGRYAKTIKESKELKPVYSLLENVNNVSNISDKVLFINEAVSMAKINDKKAYSNDLKKISNIIKEGVKLLNISENEINDILNKFNNKLDESINYLIFNKKNFNNLNTYINHVSTLSTFLKENKNNDIDAINVENETFDTIKEGLESWECELVDKYSLATLSNTPILNLFEEYKNSCLDIINNSIDETNLSEKSQLLLMKEQLENVVFDEADALKKLTYLAELKHTLEA